MIPGATREACRGDRQAAAFLVLSVLLCSPAVVGQDVPKPSEANFYAHIAPILKRSCLGCHSGKKPKGRYSMESPEEVLAGARRGRTVVAGKPAQSLLFRMITGKEKPLMPPRKAEPLGQKDILTIGAWIKGGARLGKPPAPARPYSVPPPRPLYRRAPVINSLLYDEAGDRLFVGGYREVLVHRVGGAEDFLDTELKDQDEDLLRIMVERAVGWIDE